jgi:hypothetical protein
MLLTREDIEELKKIHKERFGEELTDDEAWEMGRRLMRLFDVPRRQPPKPTRIDGIRRKHEDGRPLKITNLDVGKS